MYINELPEGTRLTITASAEDKQATLESEILPLTQNDLDFLAELLARSKFRACVAVTLFVSDNQTINFASPNVQCDCIGIFEELPYMWENVKIVKFALPDAGRQHVIFSSHDARSFNRRKDFRLWLGEECTLTYGSPAVTKRGTIRDFSVTGMGLLVSPDIKIAPGTRIRVQFSERKKVGEEEQTIVYTVFVCAVRFAPVNARNQIIGCRIIDGGRDYVGYFYKKQRESMQREKGTDL
ncbi:MAG: PilZ domain-containing protein [Blautia sp.]|nr:PilZ domain-containing protein [Blautia sp.]